MVRTTRIQPVVVPAMLSARHLRRTAIGCRRRSTQSTFSPADRSTACDAEILLRNHLNFFDRLKCKMAVVKHVGTL